MLLPGSPDRDRPIEPDAKHISELTRFRLNQYKLLFPLQVVSPITNTSNYCLTTTVVADYLTLALNLTLQLPH